MQTWMPPPKPMCSAAFARPTSSRSGSSKTRGSRLAAPNSIETTSPRGIGTPATSTPSSSTQRSKSWSGGSQRISSSTAVAAARPRPTTSRAHSPGWRSSARTPLPSVLTVASCPAFSSTTTVETISSSESRPPSTRASTSARHEVVARRAAALLDQLEHVVAELRGRRVADAACSSRRVELVHLHVPVRPVEQVAVAVGGHAEQPADQRDRVRLREVVEQVETTALEAAVEQLARELLAPARASPRPRAA